MTTKTTKPILLSLVPETSEALKTPVPVINLTLAGAQKALSDFANLMHETRTAYKAIGLAANQVGTPLRMFVMGIDGHNFTCINPEIVKFNGDNIKIKEGCLSFPGLLLDVTRRSDIDVKYYDENLNLIECSFSGMLARCFIHELDHLNGVTFTERVSKLRLDMGRKKASKR
jgi:peptide deformylase